MPASFARRSTILCTDRGVIFPIALPDLSILTNRASSASARLSIYFFIAIFASGERKTTRILPPFPWTDSSPRSRSIYRFKLHSSDNRRPVEKKSSRIALSRSARIFFSFGDSRRRARSLYSRISICRSGILGSSIFSAESASMSRFERYFKKFRIAIT